MSKKRANQFFEIFPGSLALNEAYPNPQKGRKPTKNKLKENIKAIIPVLFRFIPENDPEWERFNKLFIQKISSRIEQEGECVEACLYDVVVTAKKYKEQAMVVLQFFEVMLEELLTHVTPNEVNMLRDTMKNMLINLDRRYLNFVGEMATLNAIMASGQYRIECLEASLPDSTSRIDFKFRRITDGEIIWIEVLNLHPDGDRLELKRDKMKQFFVSRYEQKIASKKTGIPFYLIPVIWLDHYTLKIVSDYFFKHPISHERVAEPLAYATFRVKGMENEVSHQFGRVSTLFGNSRKFFSAEFE